MRQSVKIVGYKTEVTRRRADCIRRRICVCIRQSISSVYHQALPGDEGSLVACQKQCCILYISKRVESNGSRLTAQKATELVVADQDIDFNAVFAPSGEDGLGVLQALKLAGVDPSLLGCRTPKLILQPMVENAIYHGLKPKEGTGYLYIHIFAEGDEILMRVEDTGMGIPKERVEMLNRELATISSDQQETGYGVRNVNDKNTGCR